MKTKTLSLVLFASLMAQAKTYFTVKDLAVDCKVKARISDVYDVKYNAGVPPQGRFNGISASLRFQAQADLVEASSGCQILTEKYQINMGVLHLFGTEQPAMPVAAGFQLGHVGEIVELKLNQNIGYQVGEGGLPLFPQAHQETLSFEFQSETYSMTAPLSFDLNWVYGITKLENMTDIQKLNLAEQVKLYMIKAYDFQGLFLQLEPTDKALKKTYAHLIWSAFADYKAKPYFDSSVFQFHVGGPGTEAAPLAVKLNEISHIPNSFKANELVQLLTDFPNWIFAGSTHDQCLNFSMSNLENFLKNIKAKLPGLSPQDRYLIADPIHQIAGTVHYAGAYCLENKVSPLAQQLATEISESVP